MVPSAFVTCASYFALPSASVSTRTMVAPGSASLATAVTFASASPVSGVSSERCDPQPCGTAAGVEPVVVVAAIEPVEEPEPLAAEASP